jgi:hypothetical protein
MGKIYLKIAIECLKGNLGIGLGLVYPYFEANNLGYCPRNAVNYSEMTLPRD